MGRRSTPTFSKKESNDSLEGNVSQEDTATSTNMEVDDVNTSKTDTTNANDSNNNMTTNRPKLLSHPLLRPPCITDIGYIQQQLNNDNDEENKNNDDDNGTDVAVAPTESTMYPKALLTGFYGSRGERIRHTVHEGALRLPRESFDVMSWKNPLSNINYYSTTHNEDNDTTTATTNLDSTITTPTASTAAATTTSSKKKTKTGNKKSATASNPVGPLYELPKLDSVIRPSLNLHSLGRIKVTYVSGQVVPSEGGSTFNPLIRSVARNQYISLPETEIQRLRGGGNDDNSNSNINTNNMANPNNQPSSSFISSTSTGNTTVPVNTAVGGRHHSTTVAPQIMTSSMQPGSTAPTSVRVVPQNTVSNMNPPVTISNAMPNSAQVNIVNSAPHSAQLLSTNQPPVTASNMSVRTTMVGSSPSGSTNTAVVSSQSGLNQPIPSQAVAPSPSINTAASVLPIVQNAQVIPLPNIPPSQWEQHLPSANDEHQGDSMSKMPKPGWFKQNVPSDFEMTVLPEWFDSSASHRTPELYIATRNNIISLSQKFGGSRYITATMARRSIPGDAGSILRLHAFLTTYALINEDAINDTAPTPALFRPQQPPPSGATVASTNQRRSSVDDDHFWSSQSIRDRLVSAVVQQASSNNSTSIKKRDRDGNISTGGTTSSTIPVIDWAAVAESIGHGVLPTDCERHFVSMSLETMRDGNDSTESQQADSMSDASSNVGTGARTELTSDNKDTNAFKVAVQRDFIKDLVSTCDPDVVRDVAVAALQSITSTTIPNKTDLSQVQADVQKATSLGLLVHNIAQEAYNEEQNVARLLSELVTVRMQKLENRMSLLDEVEGLLEAERVSLELERRDLYTARCRHWFGGT
jgi:SWIRM domain/SWIRM-associated region 1